MARRPPVSRGAADIKTWLDEIERELVEATNLAKYRNIPTIDVTPFVSLEDVNRMARVIRELVDFVDKHPCEFSRCPFEENLSDDIQELKEDRSCV